jgi:hypothetical protein
MYCIKKGYFKKGYFKKGYFKNISFINPELRDFNAKDLITKKSTNGDEGEGEKVVIQIDNTLMPSSLTISIITFVISLFIITPQH